MIIAHNCRIGANTVIVGCCGISGSVEISRNCVVGQVGVADHVRIGDNVKILARAAVFKKVAANPVISGTPGPGSPRGVARPGLSEKTARGPSRVAKAPRVLALFAVGIFTAICAREREVGILLNPVSHSRAARMRVYALSGAFWSF